MKRIRVLTTVAVVAATALATTAGGCGSNGPSSSSTHTTIKGNPDAANKCSTKLVLQHPVNKQLTATYTVSCNFPIASATVSLVIQARPAGGSNTQWDNVDDPKTSSQIPTSLTYTFNCLTGHDYQASATVDALADDGSPVSTSDTAGPESYGPSECSGS